MKRRDALKIGAVSIILNCFSGGSVAQELFLDRKKNLDVRFTDGVRSFALPDGSWNLWVRAAPRGFQAPIVRLRLQVAEDESFNSIIAEQIHNAVKQSSYILRTNFATKKEASKFYFRFVALDSGLPDRPNEVISSSVGVLTPFVG